MPTPREKHCRINLMNKLKHLELLHSKCFSCGDGSKNVSRGTILSKCIMKNSKGSID